MGKNQLKTEVHQLVDKLDESFLKVVHSMLDTYVQQQEEDPVVSYDIDGTPRTASELADMLDKEAEAAKHGSFLSIEDFQKQSAEWGMPTK